MKDFVVHVGDCREVMETMPEQSVQCVVTSPPYWALRDYGIEDEGGVGIGAYKVADTGD